MICTQGEIAVQERKHALKEEAHEVAIKGKEQVIEDLKERLNKAMQAMDLHSKHQDDEMVLSIQKGKDDAEKLQLEHKLLSQVHCLT